MKTQSFLELKIKTTRREHKSDNYTSGLMVGGIASRMQNVLPLHLTKTQELKTDIIQTDD